MKKPTLQDVRDGLGKGALAVATFASAFLPAVPAMAQSGKAPKLEAGKDLTFICVNVQHYEKKGYPLVAIDRTLDRDGDIRTTNDQVHDVRLLSTLTEYPQLVMKIGDEVVAILTAQDIKDKTSGYVISINGRNIR
jgi:hypothetical protein